MFKNNNTINLSSSQDDKWEILRRRSWPFRYIPFVDFGLGAGSMAFGNAREDSDFDVIVSARHGRIFTVRFLCWLVFGLFGWRAKHKYSLSSFDDDRGAKNKFCFSHFVTEKSYKLSPPYNEYWQKLYQNLVPIYGHKDLIKKFWEENRSWAGEKEYVYDHFFGTRLWLVNKIAERFMGGFLGRVLETILRKIQVFKIKNNIKKSGLGYEPRIKYSSAELEFHPDTKRTFDI